MLLAAVFVIGNLLLWGAIFVVQSYEARRGMIPPRSSWGSPSPFLYGQDWHTIHWGDPIGFSLVDAAAGLYLSTHRMPDVIQIALAIVLGAIATWIFAEMARDPRHRPDAGTPRPGHFSLTGKIHLVYFFVQACLSALLIELLIMDYLHGILLAIALTGGLVYALSFLCDWYSGRFSLLAK